MTRHTNTRTLSRLVMVIVAFVLASFALADEPITTTDISKFLANSLDAIHGCVIQDAVRSDGADCFVLDVSSGTARTLIDAQLARYSDVTPIEPWVRQDSGLWRPYKFGDLTVAILLLSPPSSQYETTVIVMMLPE